MAQLEIPSPLAHQIPILVDGGRFKWIACGRRFGKSILEIIAVVIGHGPQHPEDGRPMFLGAIHGQPMAWVSKNSTTALEHWTILVKMLGPVTVRKLEDEKIIFIMGGGSVRVLSCDQPDSLRGAGFTGIVMDEAPHSPEAAYTILRPTISEIRNVGHPNWFIGAGTANGKNWFWKRWDAARKGRPGHSSFRGISEENPLISKDEIEEARQDMPEADFRREYRADFEAEAADGFKREWLKTWMYEPKHQEFNVYVLVDPASKKKQNSDYTALWVVGLAPDQNFYVLDVIRDRFNLMERADQVFALVKKWWPRQGTGIIEVRYEEYGLQADIEYINDRQNRENFRFPVTAVSGILSKEDRIRRLQPSFRQGRWYFPQTRMYKDHSGTVFELISEFTEVEYTMFPGTPPRGHFDLLDALSRIIDSKNPPIWPAPRSTTDPENELNVHARRRKARAGQGKLGWLAS